MSAPVLQLPTAASGPVRNPVRRGRFPRGVTSFEAARARRCARNLQREAEALGREAKEATHARPSVPDVEALAFQCMLLAELAKKAAASLRELHGGVL